MIQIKEQTVDSAMVRKDVLAKVFGEHYAIDLDLYLKFCTLIEETLLYLKGENYEH